jgi:hypothetical protein
VRPAYGEDWADAISAIIHGPSADQPRGRQPARANVQTALKQRRAKSDMRNMPTNDEEPWENDRRRLGDARARALWERRRRELGLRKRRLVMVGGRAYGVRSSTRRFVRIALLAVLLAVFVTLVAAWSDLRQEPPHKAANAGRAHTRVHAHRHRPSS